MILSDSPCFYSVQGKTWLLFGLTVKQKPVLHEYYNVVRLVHLEFCHMMKFVCTLFFFFFFFIFATSTQTARCYPAKCLALYSRSAMLWEINADIHLCMHLPLLFTRISCHQPCTYRWIIVHVRTRTRLYSHLVPFLWNWVCSVR